MRIRSIKPEFWRSEDISSLRDWNDRFLFIGLWSYVDDNGVGLDRLSLIATDLFADDVERDPSETFARVSRGLQNLSEHGRITRYRVDGKDYLHITNWTKHQRIDKPNKPRYPLPTSENVESREGVAESSRECRESPAPGTGEQGNRGTGDKRRAPAKPDASKPRPVEQIATTNAYERCGKAFNYVAVMKMVKWAIHDRGESPDRVETALVEIHNMGKPITKQTIGQFLDGTLGGRTWQRKSADDDALDILARGQRLAAQLEHGAQKELY